MQVEEFPDDLPIIKDTKSKFLHCIIDYNCPIRDYNDNIFLYCWNGTHFLTYPTLTYPQEINDITLEDSTLTYPEAINDNTLEDFTLTYPEKINDNILEKTRSHTRTGFQKIPLVGMQFVSRSM